MRPLLLLGLVITLAAGCASPAGQYDSVKRKPTQQIDIFRDGKMPSVAYKEIGLLTDEAREIEEPEVEGKMIQRAKRMGGNAIIFEPKKQTGHELSGFYAVSTTYLYKARVLVYE